MIHSATIVGAPDLWDQTPPTSTPMTSSSRATTRGVKWDELAASVMSGRDSQTTCKPPTARERRPTRREEGRVRVVRAGVGGPALAGEMLTGAEWRMTAAGRDAASLSHPTAARWGLPDQGFRHPAVPVSGGGGVRGRCLWGVSGLGGWGARRGALRREGRGARGTERIGRRFAERASLRERRASGRRHPRRPGERSAATPNGTSRRTTAPTPTSAKRKQSPTPDVVRLRPVRGFVS